MPCVIRPSCSLRCSLAPRRRFARANARLSFCDVPPHAMCESPTHAHCAALFAVRRRFARANSDYMNVNGVRRTRQTVRENSANASAMEVEEDADRLLDQLAGDIDAKVLLCCVV